MKMEKSIDSNLNNFKNLKIGNEKHIYHTYIQIHEWNNFHKENIKPPTFDFFSLFQDI